MSKKVTANRATAIIIFVIFLVVVAMYVATQAVGGNEPQQGSLGLGDFERVYAQTLEGQETENNFIYNGIVFVKVDDLWKTLLQEANGNETYLLTTHKSPRDVEFIPIDDGMRSLIIPKDLMILTTDAERTSEAFIGIYELGRIIGNNFGFLNKQAVLALTTPVNETLVATCDNVSRTTGVIYFHLEDETEVYEQDGCIHVTAPTEEELVIAADRLLFVLLGIQAQDPLIATTFTSGLALADWKGDQGKDGFALSIDFSDSEGTPVSAEGIVIANITANGQLVEEWRTPLVLSYYNQSGTANLNLAMQSLNFLTSNATLEANIAVLQKDTPPLMGTLRVQ